MDKKVEKVEVKVAKGKADKFPTDLIQEGDIVKVTPSTAKKLIANGYAEAVGKKAAAK
jgi:hypothetical protein